MKAASVERAVHSVVLMMAAGLIVGALVVPVPVHAEELEIAISENSQTRWMIDTSSPARPCDGALCRTIISYGPQGRAQIFAQVSGCAQGYGKIGLFLMRPDRSDVSKWDEAFFWTRTGGRVYDFVAVGVCLNAGSPT